MRRSLAGTAMLGLSLGSRAAVGQPTSTAIDGATPILQLYTDEISAQFRLLLESLDGISIRALGPDGLERPVQVLSSATSPYRSVDSVLHVRVDGLVPGRDHRLQLLDHATGIVYDERLFRSLDLSGTKARFAFLSCSNDLFPNQDEMWDALARTQPDVIFMIGDNCYADLNANGSLSDFWRRHGETRRGLDHFKWKRLIPTLSVWDDHDFAGNNVDRTTGFGEAALRCFEMYFGSARGPALEHGPGVSQLFRFRGQRFFLMDDRYFRDPPGLAQGLHWGEEQESWLFAKLKESTEPAWIMNGSQFFGGYMDKDSFEQNHPHQFERVIRRLREIEAPVVFGSGDVHFSEIMRLEPALLGYGTYELTSSSMHSFTFPLHEHRFDNPRRLVSTWHHNFVLVESEVSSGGFELRARSVGAGQTVYFDERLSIEKARAVSA